MSIGGMIVLGKNWCRSSRKSCPSTILSTTKLSHYTTLLTTNHSAGGSHDVIIRLPCSVLVLVLHEQSYNEPEF